MQIRGFNKILLICIILRPENRTGFPLTNILEENRNDRAKCDYNLRCVSEQDRLSDKETETETD